MASIKQLKVGSSTYDLKATYDGSGNTISSYYVKKNGDTMSGTLTLEQGAVVYSTTGTAGSTGYVKIAQIVISGTYRDAPIEITYARRGDLGMTRIFIKFTNVKGNDPALQSFGYIGFTNSAYMVKNTTSTWDLYIAKSEAYDRINIVDFKKPQYLSSTLTVTWANEHATALPDGYVQATPIGTIGTANALAGTLGVAGGGTGTTSFTANSIIVSGSTTTAALTTKGILTSTAVGDAGWGTTANRTKIPDISVLAFWNGAHSGTSSNLAYCNKGAFGTGAIRTIPGNISTGTATPSGGSAGDIYIQYS